MNFTVIKEFISDVLTGSPLAVSTLICRVLMLIGCCVFIFSLIKYLRTYKIFQGLFSKITGNAREYDRIRRTQMREEINKKKKSFQKNEKVNPIISIYSKIYQTGIVEKIPGFSEFGFLVVVIMIGLIIFSIFTYKQDITTGLFAMGGFLLVAWYSLSLIAYNRRTKLESQLLQFTNACASASMQYSNIIDIFGAIYEQFSAPLKEGLEGCYVEAKQTNDKALALKHLKDKYDSTQFSFVIDNLELCSSKTGDYYTVARDISDTISIYSSSHEKKRALLRNAKINITAMFAIGIGILFSLSKFLGNLNEVLFHTTFGNISLIGLVLLYFYGLNMKAEK